MNTEKFENLVNDFKKLDLKTIKEKPTYLEIIGKRHLEDVSSRVLAFFFDTSKEHDLGDVCLQALLAVYNTKLDKNDRYEEDILETSSVNREVSTSSMKDEPSQELEDGRIDLLIETDKKIILIENKINHSNNNPFETYWQYVNQRKFDGKEKFCILLVKDKTKSPHEHFEVITHFEWIEELKKRLPEVWQQADNKYLIFLMDYICAIDSLNPEKKRNKMDNQILKLFKEHHKTLIKLEEQTEKVCEFYHDELQELINNNDLNMFNPGNVSYNDGSYKYLGAFVYTKPYIYKTERNLEYKISCWLGWNLSSFMLGIALIKGGGKLKKHDEMQKLLKQKGIQFEVNNDSGEIYLVEHEERDLDKNKIAKEVAEKMKEVIEKLELE